MNTNPQAKNILIYGDSLTYGKIPGGARYDNKTRFSGVLQKLLGNGFSIIEEGLRGRMLGGENLFFPHRDGLTQFGPIFGSHAPVDMVIFVLGTNDCNSGTNPDYDYVSQSFDNYRSQLTRWCSHFNISEPKIVIVSPPVTNEQYSYEIFKDIFKGSDAKFQGLSKHIQQYSEQHNISYIDASNIEVSHIDGIHLDEAQNTQLAQLIYQSIIE